MFYAKFLILFFCLLVFLHPYESTHANDLQPLVNNLAEAGHRDIEIIQNSDTLKVYYWPIGFRDSYQGFVDIKKRISEIINKSPNIGVEFVELIQTSWGIPTVNAQFQRRLTNKIHFTKKYYASYKKTNFSSIIIPTKKLMILFDIPLYASFGQPYDPLVFKTGISPEIRYRLSKFLFAYCQVDFYFHNEFDKNQYFKPGNIGLMVAKTIKDNMISITNIGAFRKDIYGIDEEINISILDDKIAFVLHGGFYGDLYFINNKFKYRKITHKLALFELIYSIASYDSKLKPLI